MNNNDKTPQKDTNSLRPWIKNGLTILFFLGVFLIIRPFMQGDVVAGQAPEMKVHSITYQDFDLQKLNAEGKPVLIHLWATWCPICEVSKGGIESIAEDYTVINIATQSADNDQLLEYAKANGMNPNIIVNDLDGKWLTILGAKAVPADFIIAPNGEVAFVEVGFTTAWGLRLRLWWTELMAS